MVQELIAGRVHFYVSPTLAIAPQYQSKQLRILAVSAPERLRSLPEIPTLAEHGINFVRFGWLGIVPPAPCSRSSICCSGMSPRSSTRPNTVH